MGLDMRPMGKPRPGCEQEFEDLFAILSGKKKESLSVFEKLNGKKLRTREELLKEWFAAQIPSYETLNAPRVGRDKAADEWIKQKYEETDKTVPLEKFITEHQGYYVIGLSPEKDGVPVYVSFGQDENVFRGQFLADCSDVIGEELVNEAWITKSARETLDYGERLMGAADKVADAHDLAYLKKQYLPPDTDQDSLESKLHIVYSLAKWLIFYGRNGHGYEADY